MPLSCSSCLQPGFLASRSALQLRLSEQRRPSLGIATQQCLALMEAAAVESGRKPLKPASAWKEAAPPWTFALLHWHQGGAGVDEEKEVLL